MTGWEIVVAILGAALLGILLILGGSRSLHHVNVFGTHVSLTTGRVLALVTVLLGLGLLVYGSGSIVGAVVTTKLLGLLLMLGAGVWVWRQRPQSTQGD